mmetsp:Transcript_34976/g.73798  ORF Transcript_34976/g.73798 Transcript_34976/m.73798 type:complete len:168 (-) Transcript_34976:120-623(-)
MVDPYCFRCKGMPSSSLPSSSSSSSLSISSSSSDLLASLSADFSHFPLSLPPSAAEAAAAAAAEGDQSQSKLQQQQRQQLEFEKHGVTFPLYHYNGLSRHGQSGGTLTPFRLTRLSPTEAVGASIALSSKGGGSGHGAGGGDLEDVVRTKWPSSMLNWFGKNPPSID